MTNMPVRLELDPPPPANSTQPGVATTFLYSGAKFQGYQKSKGNSYEVEVVLQVWPIGFLRNNILHIVFLSNRLHNSLKYV